MQKKLSTDFCFDATQFQTLFIRADQRIINNTHISVISSLSHFTMKVSNTATDCTSGHNYTQRQRWQASAVKRTTKENGRKYSHKNTHTTLATVNKNHKTNAHYLR